MRRTARNACSIISRGLEDVTEVGMLGGAAIWDALVNSPRERHRPSPTVTVSDDFFNAFSAEH